MAGWVPLGQSRAGTALGTFHRKECGEWAARTSQGSHCDAPPPQQSWGLAQGAEGEGQIGGWLPGPEPNRETTGQSGGTLAPAPPPGPFILTLSQPPLTRTPISLSVSSIRLQAGRGPLQAQQKHGSMDRVRLAKDQWTGWGWLHHANETCHRETRRRGRAKMGPAQIWLR